MSGKKSKEKAKRQVVYPTLEVIIKEGADAITVQEAKDWLGWEVEEGEVKFGNDFPALTTDIHGKKIRCWHNTHNRPFDRAKALHYAQEILTGNWRFNGETMVISRTGETSSCQHRLIGLIFAGQLWEQNKEHWKSNWKTEPTMESLVTKGASDDPEVIRTLDNVKTRSLEDVMFTMDLFRSYRGQPRIPSERKVLIRMARDAIRMLWHRTGADRDAFTPKDTHSESIDWINRHPKLLDCVQHIWEENQATGKDHVLFGCISDYLPPGYASALLFLMGCSASNGEKYRATERTSEKILDWSRWERACEFWFELKSRSSVLEEVRFAKRFSGPNTDEIAASIFSKGEGGGSVFERMAVVTKAWNCFVAEEPITSESLQLEYDIELADDKSILVQNLIEFPSVGGIDLGNAKREEEDEDTEEQEELEATPKSVPTPRPKRVIVPEPAVERTLKDELDDLKSLHPGKILLFKIAKVYKAWDADALTVSVLLKLSMKKQNEMQCVEFPHGKLEENLRKLLEAGNRVAICEQVGSETQVFDPPLPIPTVTTHGEVTSETVTSSADTVPPIPPTPKRKPKVMPIS